MNENYILKFYAPNSQKQIKVREEQQNLDIETLQKEVDLKEKEIDRLNEKLKDPNWVMQVPETQMDIQIDILARETYGQQDSH